MPGLHKCNRRRVILNTTPPESLTQYVSRLFVPEDEALQALQRDAADQGLPTISLKPYEAQMLHWLLRLMNARRGVEIGTLAGYSAVWLARALPADGMLYTLEKSARHAAVARANFARAGIAERVRLLEGEALALLGTLNREAPFDFVFIDADKGGYPAYLAWAAEHLRPGGLVAAHNAFRGGSVLDPRSDDDRAIHAFNVALAQDARFHSTIIAAGDGMAAAIRK